MDKKTIAIGVPCYNEEKSIPVFIDTFLKNEDIKKLEAKYKFIFIFVDDGSTDKTKEILEKTSQERDDFYFISFDHNRGKESGLVAIYDAAISLKVDALIKMDVDLQDPPNLIPKFVEDWERGYIYIYGHSNGRKGQKFIKKFFSSGFYKVYSWVSLEWGMKDGDRDFSLMDKSILPEYAAIKGPYRFDRSIRSHLKIKSKSINYDFVDRSDGTTRWPFKRLMSYSLNAMRQFGALTKFFTRIITEILFIVGLALIITYCINKSKEMLLASIILFCIALLFEVILKLEKVYLEKHLFKKYRNYEMYKIGKTNIEELQTESKTK